MTDFDITFIFNTPLFRKISEEEFSQICAIISPAIKTYNKNEIITMQGEEVWDLGILKEGSVFAAKYHYDGSTQLLKLLHSKDILGLESVSSTFCTSPCTLTAGEYCSVVFFSYDRLINSGRLAPKTEKILMQNILNILSDENIRSMYKVDVLSRRTLRERITTHLSIISEKRNKKSFDIGMTQEQFAQYLCVNRSVLSNELNKMRKDGLIDFHRSFFTIYD